MLLNYQTSETVVPLIMNISFKRGTGTIFYKVNSNNCFVFCFQTHQVLRIPVVNDMEFEKDENFEVELFDPEGGAKIGKVSRSSKKTFFQTSVFLEKSWFVLVLIKKV